MKFNLKVWRQKNKSDKGKMQSVAVDNISPDSSFLEMLDQVNEELIDGENEPIAFDHDCREGICGACSLMINGEAHGPRKATTACQLHMREFKDGETIYIEPWRAKAFPVIKDLVVDRQAFDKIIQAGGYISANTGNACDANALPVSKEIADEAFNSATCIGCGACVASCKNASAMLFVGAKVSQLASLPQGQPERKSRVKNMVTEMDAQGFGNCTNQYECEAACPKEISRENIATLNREFLKS